jgi:hypothetical protein
LEEQYILAPKPFCLVLVLLAAHSPLQAVEIRLAAAFALAIVAVI